MRFGGYSTATTGTRTHLGHYWYPQWDLFMTEMMDRSGYHRESLNHIGCVMAARSKSSIYRLCVCVFVWSVLGALLLPTIRGLPLCVFVRTYGVLLVPVCMYSDYECSLANWWRSIGFIIDIILHFYRINP